MKPVIGIKVKAGFALTSLLLIGLAPPTALSESIPPQSHDNTNQNHSLGHFAASTVHACTSAFQSSLNVGSDCLLGQLVNTLLLNGASRWANARGKQLFGQHFSLTNRFTYSAGGFKGEMDAVIPVMAFSGGNTPNAGAFFLQNGITRYIDGQGFPRTDLRYGALRRFNITRQPGANVFGVSTFYQQNLEYGHARVALGMDYGGAWGNGAFNYFLPTTGWRESTARPVHEERTLGGMELSFRLAPTNTVGVETALTRWEARDGSGRRDNGARLGLQWQPHDWLNIGIAQDGIGTPDAQSSVLLAFKIPLDRDHRLPLWRGLGLDEEKRPGSPVSMWRPVENIGQIRLAERAITTERNAERLLRNLDVQFLQQSASSGEAIRVQVTLQAPVTTATRIYLRLKPGKGDNPAVPGEDYVDEPVEMTIPRGERAWRFPFNCCGTMVCSKTGA